MDPTIEKLLHSGDLTGALAQAEADLAASPDDPTLNFLMFELRVLTGDFDAAQEHLDALSGDQWEAPREHFGGMLSAERKRALLIGEGRGAPAFLIPPPDALKLHYAAVVKMHFHTDEEIPSVLASSTPRRTGTIDGEPFLALRDCDGLLGPVLEFFVPGAYGWLPLAQLKRVRLLPPQGYPDVIWIPAWITLTDDQERFVRIPSLYAGSGGRSDGERLGLETRWERPMEGLARAYGQRDLVVVDASGQSALRGIRQIHEILFS
jgi:type VI secretion system protein ImpE